ncbi:MAG: extracellular catalytic domain type 1 short-chain-length polyhydroxyalkanoate depolymerase [Pseudonocardiaceae bacterium]
MTTVSDKQSGISNPPSPAQPRLRSPWEGPFLYVSGSRKRPYYVYTPASYEPGTSAPLLVMLHGCSQTPRGSAVATQWNDLAEEHKIVVVYPGQTIQVLENAITGSAQRLTEDQIDHCWSDGNGDHCWNWFLPEHQKRDAGEPAIIAGIARAVMASTEKWTIDPGRVYVAGMSAGGAMAVILGATYPELFSGVAVHSGVEYKAATDGLSALRVLEQGGPDPVGQGGQAFRAMGHHARLMPVIVVHGSEDRRNIASNGELAVRQWLETNRLATGGAFNAEFSKPSSDNRYGEPMPGGHPYRVRRWTANGGKVVQEYWTVDGLAHAWSGGYWLGSFADPRGPSASRAMYAFLSRQ